GSNRLPLLGTIRPEICEDPRLISQFQCGAKGQVVGMRSLHSPSVQIGLSVGESQSETRKNSFCGNEN
ncbi:hypothetical protein, partial [Xenorhabdus sp. GDc328]|uniref:hypothetical protein n=1 Tax=Xenorhabdus sp. GDc328 TaxID=742178 RepID=UPI001F2BF690